MINGRRHPLRPDPETGELDHLCGRADSSSRALARAKVFPIPSVGHGDSGGAEVAEMMMSQHACQDGGWWCLPAILGSVAIAVECGKGEGWEGSRKCMDEVCVLRGRKTPQRCGRRAAIGGEHLACSTRRLENLRCKWQRDSSTQGDVASTHGELCADSLRMARQKQAIGSPPRANGEPLGSRTGSQASRRRSSKPHQRTSDQTMQIIAEIAQCGSVSACRRL